MEASLEEELQMGIDQLDLDLLVVVVEQKIEVEEEQNIECS
jgi:hypothetical protein